jgi:DNA-binding response OmpR family regulator
VILKTAAPREEGHRDLGVAAGAAAYFSEPFDPQAVIAAVRGVLGDGGSPQPT